MTQAARDTSAKRSTNPQEFDPANDTHYAIGERDEYHLRRIGQALTFAGQLFAQQDPEKGDNGEDDIAALLETFGFAINGALERRVIVFPRAGRSRRPGAAA